MHPLASSDSQKWRLEKHGANLGEDEAKYL